MLHTVRHTTKELATAATRLDLRDGRSEDRLRLVISCMVSGWTYPATHGSRSKTEPGLQVALLRCRLPSPATCFLQRPCGIDRIADSLKRHILTVDGVRNPTACARRRSSKQMTSPKCEGTRPGSHRPHSAELLLKCIQCLWISQGAGGPWSSVGSNLIMHLIVRLRQVSA